MNDKKWGTLKAVFQVNAQERLVLVYLIIASIGINIFTLAFPIAVLQVYDRVLPNQATYSLIALTLIVGLALVLETMARIARASISAWADAKHQHQTSCQAFNSLLSTPINVYELQGAGAHLENINALNSLKDFHMGQAIVNIIDLPFVVLFVGMIAYLGGWVAIVPMITIMLVIMRTTYKAPGLYAEIQSKKLSDEHKSNFSIEVLSNVLFVKALAMESLILRRFERLQKATTKSNFELHLKAAKTATFLTIMSQLTMVGVACLGAYLVVQGQISIGVLAASILLSGRCIQPIGKAVNIWNRLQGIFVSSESFKQLQSLPKEYSDDEQEIEIDQGRIKLDHVTFHYTEDTPAILTDISLKIEPGEMIGITGDSSSGKSTLLGLMNRMYNPTSGTIKIDDQDITKHHVHSVRQSICYIPHNDVIFEGTIMENLTRFRGGQYENRAKEICKQLNLYSKIIHMADGFDTIVGDEALKAIPGGIKQLIVITRALIDDPKIVLFDEGNTGIDIHTDKYVQEYFRNLKGEKTIIIVSQRPSMLAACDRVYSLNEGRLICQD